MFYCGQGGPGKEQKKPSMKEVIMRYVSKYLSQLEEGIFKIGGWPGRFRVTHLRLVVTDAY